MIEIYYSKIGKMYFATALENGKIVATAFSRGQKTVLESILRNIPYNVPFKLAEETTSFANNVLCSLKAIFKGESVSCELEFEMKYLSPYSRKVLKCLRYVPIGYVATYGGLSKVCGGSPRSVGRVMASNPFPLLIPCHRVIRSDMSLGGFGCGVEAKWEILQNEDRGFEKPSKVRVFEKDLILYPVKYVKAPRQG